MRVDLFACCFFSCSSSVSSHVAHTFSSNSNIIMLSFCWVCECEWVFVMARCVCLSCVIAACAKCRNMPVSHQYTESNYSMLLDDALSRKCCILSLDLTCNSDSVSSLSVHSDWDSKSFIVNTWSQVSILRIHCQLNFIQWSSSLIGWLVCRKTYTVTGPQTTN